MTDESRAPWRVLYAPGDNLLLAGPAALVALPADAVDDATVWPLWTEVARASGTDALAAALASAGVDALPTFAAVVREGERVLALLRGQVSLVAADGSEIASGRTARTWTEVALTDDEVGITLGGCPKARGRLPLVAGIASAGNLWLDSSTSARVALPGLQAVAGLAAAVEPAGRPAGATRVDRSERPDGSESAERPAGRPQSAERPATLPQAADPAGDGGHGTIVMPPVWQRPTEEPAPALISGVPTSIPPAAAASSAEQPAVQQPAQPPAQEAARPTPAAQPPFVQQPVAQQAAGQQPAAQPPAEPEGSGTVYVSGLASTHKPRQAGDEHQVLACVCPAGHPNPQGLPRCGRCGEAITDLTPRLVDKPVLAQLVSSQGQRVNVSHAVFVGRAPGTQGDDYAEVMTVPSPSSDISRTHLKISVQDWQIRATDLHSKNGTVLLPPGAPPGAHGRSLMPGEPTVIPPGARLDLGDGVVLRLEPAPR